MSWINYLKANKKKKKKTPQIATKSSDYLNFIFKVAYMPTFTITARKWVTYFSRQVPVKKNLVSARSQGGKPLECEANSCSHHLKALIEILKYRYRPISKRMAHGVRGKHV